MKLLILIFFTFNLFHFLIKLPFQLNHFSFILVILILQFVSFSDQSVQFILHLLDIWELFHILFLELLFHVLNRAMILVVLQISRSILLVIMSFLL